MTHYAGRWFLHVGGRIAVMLLLTIVSVTAHPLSAAVLEVPTHQPTVRAAVDAAATGDTVLVAPGLHAGGAFIDGKSLTIASRYLVTGDTAFVAQTILDAVVGDVCRGAAGCAGNAVLEFGANADGSAVVGLTISNGENGVASGSTVDISHCRVIRNGDGVDYVNGSGGTLRNSHFLDNSDDGIDLNDRIEMTIIGNVIRDNRDDGIEFRLRPYTGPTARVDMVGNLIAGNGEDGIQLIDYPGLSDHVVRIERNVFRANFDGTGASAAVGCMANGETVEDLSGAPMEERVQLFNNTFVDERNGFVGGANVVAVNNIFVGTAGSAVRRMAGNSIVSYCLFWNNGTDHEESVVDLSSILSADPGLDPEGRLTSGSPAIDAGTAHFEWQGVPVLDLPPGSYQGSAPDLGAFEFILAGPANQAPGVEAGADQAVALGEEAVLDGTVSDDGLPAPARLTTTWTVGSGPGAVTFADAQAVDTRASFTGAGVYVLRLTASDGALSATDSVRVTVGAVAGTVERGIAAAEDDMEEMAGGGFSANVSDLELVDGGSLQTVGLRFTDVAVPAGAVITGAWVQFEADEVQSEATTLWVHGQAADDAEPFTLERWNVSGRARTGAGAEWTPPPWTVVGAAGVDQRTPDLRGVVQEIVDRPGWASGNAVALIITGSGHRTARSYEGRAAGAPRLRIEYGAGGMAPAEPAFSAAAADPRPSFALHSASPRPAHGVLHVDFSLPDAQRAALEVIDVAGRRMLTRDVGALGAGRHRVDLRDGLPAGIYLLRLTQGGRTDMTKAVVLK